MALFTIVVWGTTFIASKILLRVYTPLQIMVMRFVLAYVMLWILRPRPLKLSLREESYFALLGTLGCTVYFLAENYALTYTLAANVSILVALAPMLTAVCAHILLPDEKLKKNVIMGFAIAIAGVALVVFNGTVILKLSPKGDFLSIGAALCWALYSVLLKRRVENYDGLLMTRRIMLWGLITSFPVMLLKDGAFSLAPLAEGSMLFCILFLGLLGSAAGYVLWNTAASRLGIVTLNNYIYINPLSTVIAGWIVLHEKISPMGWAGAVLILLGIFVADRGNLLRKAEENGKIG